MRSITESAVSFTPELADRLGAYLGIGHALGNRDNTDGETSDEISCEPSEIWTRINEKKALMKYDVWQHTVSADPANYGEETPEVVDGL